MRRRILVSLAVAALLSGLVISAPITASAKDSPIKRAAKGLLMPAVIKAPGFSATSNSIKTAPLFSSGLLQAAHESLERADASSGEGSLSVSESSLGCGHRNPAGNVRVNQDCTYRRQAETTIAVNPIDPNNLIAGQNDSRVGFNHCGIDYSFDGGRSWGDQLPPFWQRLNRNPAGHTILGGPPALRTYDAASDPALTFDSQGRAFFTCVLFDIADNANGILVATSPARARGSFFNNVPPGSKRSPATFVVVVDNHEPIAHHKEFIIAHTY